MDNAQLDQWGLGETEEQRLASSLHYVVDKIVNANNEEPPVHRLAVAMLTGVVTDVLDTMGEDLNMFALHRKGKFVNEKDVYLCVRKNPEVIAKLKEFKQTLDEEEGLAVSAAKKKKKSNPQPDNLDD